MKQDRTLNREGSEARRERGIQKKKDEDRKVRNRKRKWEPKRGRTERDNSENIGKHGGDVRRVRWLEVRR